MAYFGSCKGELEVLGEAADSSGRESPNKRSVLVKSRGREDILKGKRIKLYFQKRKPRVERSFLLVNFKFLVPRTYPPDLPTKLTYQQLKEIRSLGGNEGMKQNLGLFYPR